MHSILYSCVQDLLQQIILLQLFVCYRVVDVCVVVTFTITFVFEFILKTDYNFDIYECFAALEIEIELNTKQSFE